MVTRVSRREPADERGWTEDAQPVPRFAAAVRVLVTAYILAIGALVVLRGIDAAFNG